MKMDINQAREILEIPLYSDIGIEEMFKLCDAFWAYKEKGPHALLANGAHSDGYFNVNEVTKFSNLCHILASDLSSKLEDIGIEKVDLIISSSFAAAPIGQAVAHIIKAISVFTEKKGKDQVWTGRFEIPKGATILHVEELITSMKTTQSVHSALLNAELSGIVPDDYEFVEYKGKPLVATIVHRPTELPINYPDFEVLPLYEKVVNNWKPDACLLCQEGSEAMKPKPNWQKFMQY